MKTLILFPGLVALLAACSPSSNTEEKKIRAADELVSLIKQQQHPDSLQNSATLVSYTTALEEYVDNYPDHAQYEALLFQAAKNAGDHKDLKKAAHYYARYAEQFPTSESGAQATFAAGFIYNNDLKQIDSARKYYSLFIANHPRHLLKPAAEAEIEHLGKTPEEMLDAIQNDKENRNVNEDANGNEPMEVPTTKNPAH